MLLVLMSIFIVCKDGNRTYMSGDIFVKDDCLERCLCLSKFPAGQRRSTFEEIGSVGVSVCISLCDSRTSLILDPHVILEKQCPVGLKFEEYQDPINGTKCFCNRSRCVKRK